MYRREKSSRTQARLAIIAAAVSAATGVSPAWAAALALSIGLVLALEAVNSALEYMIDHLHPEIAGEIGCAKDAATGAVPIASTAAVVWGLQCCGP